jgi:hypothetical protein
VEHNFACQRQLISRQPRPTFHLLQPLLNGLNALSNPSSLPAMNHQAYNVVCATLSTTITTDPSHNSSSSPSLLPYRGQKSLIKSLGSDARPRPVHESHFNAIGKSRCPPQRSTTRQSLPIGVKQNGLTTPRTRRDARSGRAVALFNGLGKSFGMSMFMLTSPNKFVEDARESFRRPTNVLHDSVTRPFQSRSYDSCLPVPTTPCPPRSSPVCRADPEVFAKIVASIILNRPRTRERRMSHLARKTKPLAKEYIPTRLSVVFTMESF